MFVQNNMANLYTKSRIAVFCFVFDEDRVLLIKRANQPYSGMLTVPGGHKEQHETLHEACRREVFEETGLKLKGISFAGIAHASEQNSEGFEYTSIYYISREFAGTLRSSGEGEVLWLAVDEVPRRESHFFHPAFLSILSLILSASLPFELELKDTAGICTVNVL